MLDAGYLSNSTSRETKDDDNFLINCDRIKGKSFFYSESAILDKL